MEVKVKSSTVNLLAKLLRPLTEAGVVSFVEEREIVGSCEISPRPAKCSRQSCPG